MCDTVKLEMVMKAFSSLDNKPILAFEDWLEGMVHEPRVADNL